MIAKEITQVDTEEGLKKLLEDNTVLTEIKLTGKALLTLKTVTSLIDKHHQTLRTIILDGAAANPKETFLVKIALLITIIKCQGLATLALENFSIFFVEPFEHALDELISSLSKLRELSFKNTRIYKPSSLSTGLAKTTSLEELDLTGTCCPITYICSGIEKNKSLKILRFGKLPIVFYSDSLFDAIIQVGNKIQFIDWEPPPFEENEEKETENLEQLGFYASNFYASNIEYLYRYGEQRKAYHEQLCTKFAKFKHFLSHRCVLPQSNQFKITLENHYSYRFDIACAAFTQQKESLTHLIFEFPSLDPQRIRIEEIDGRYLLEALNICEHLQEITFINMQSYFGYLIVKIIDVLACLPHLQKVTFTHSYLGERGVEALSALLRKNILEELKVSHVGFSNENCFMILMRALKDNTSSKKLHFGTSPMTLSWIRILANFVFFSNNMTLKKIEWLATNFKAMEESMLLLFGPRNQCLYINSNFEYQLQQFLDQPAEHLVSHWMLFQNLLTMKLNPMHSAQKQKKMMRELLNNILGIITESHVNESVEEGQPLNRLPGRSYA